MISFQKKNYIDLDKAENQHFSNIKTGQSLKSPIFHKKNSLHLFESSDNYTRNYNKKDYVIAVYFGLFKRQFVYTQCFYSYFLLERLPLYPKTDCIDKWNIW